MDKIVRACNRYITNLYLDNKLDQIETDFQEDIKLSEMKEYFITLDGNEIKSIYGSKFFNNKSKAFYDLIGDLVYEKIDIFNRYETLHEIYDLIKDIYKVRKDRLMNDDYIYLLNMFLNNKVEKNKYIDYKMKNEYNYAIKPTKPNIEAMKQHYEKYGNIRLGDLFNYYLFNQN